MRKCNAPPLNAQMRCMCVYNQRLQKGSTGGAWSVPRRICPLHNICHTGIFRGTWCEVVGSFMSWRVAVGRTCARCSRRESKNGEAAHKKGHRPCGVSQPLSKIQHGGPLSSATSPAGGASSPPPSTSTYTHAANMLSASYAPCQSKPTPRSSRTRPRAHSPKDSSAACAAARAGGQSRRQCRGCSGGGTWEMIETVSPGRDAASASSSRGETLGIQETEMHHERTSRRSP